MKLSLMAFGFGLILITIISRAIPLGKAPGNPAVLAGLLLPSVMAGVLTYRIYRRELVRIGKPERRFPVAMGFITSVLLIQLSVRISQIV